MAELPYMSYVPTEYLGDTNHLSTLEHGAYHLLILQYWINGAPLVDDDNRLSRITKMSKRQWLKVRPVLEEFFICDGVTWMHKRIELDLKKAREKVQLARKAGMISAQKRSNQKSGRKNKFSARQVGKRDAQKKDEKPNENSESDPTDVATDAQQTLNGRGNGTATNHYSKNNPLTPLPRDRAAPAPSGGRAASESEARSIGEILQEK